MKSLVARPLRLALRLALLLPFVACREPTELEVRITTDIPCARLGGTSVVTGAAHDYDLKAAVAASTRCDASGDLGSLVVVPSGGKTEEVAIKLVAGIDRDPSTCAAAFGPGCVVARRIIRYTPHRPLRLIVPLRESCSGVICDPQTTCVRGICVDATIADPGACASAACDEASLGGGSANAPDASTPAADGGSSAEAGPPGGLDGSAAEGGAPEGGAPEGGAPAGASALMFGGLGPSIDLGDAWEWDGASWTQRAVSGPTGRALAGMASLGGKIVLFGGNGAGNVYLADTWTWDGASWAQGPAGPSGRQEHAMASLPGKIVLFGGLNASGQALADTWLWDGAAWAPVAGGGPSARHAHAMAAFGTKVVLFGGTDASDTVVFADTWEFDGAVWTQRQVVSGPPGRYDAAMAQVGSKLVLYGGTQSWTNSQLGDTWEWDGATWTQRPEPGPPARFGMSAATVNGKLVMTQGQTRTAAGVGGTPNDTWEWDGTAWTQRAVTTPPARTWAAMSAR